MAAALLCGTASAQAASPLLVILRPTGQTRDGLPVLTRHTDAAAVEAVLTRGFSGRFLRLHALEQAFLSHRTGRAPEPAYLLLSDRQGGFPQFGFYLDDEKKADVGWVDLHRSSTVSGRFGAMDQIFPHELLHVIVRQLAGEPRESGGNQVHAVGVRTDPVNAFDEGFAEHVQIMAVDDPEAVPETRALVGDPRPLERATRDLERYARELSWRWAPVRPSQVRFLLWFGRTEQALRYHAVKANLFAHESPVPASLLDRHDKYQAYLWQNVVPGTPDGAAKSAPVMLSTEGVVAHLVWRFVTDPALQQQPESDVLARFGVVASEVTPLETVYLKLFVALADGRPGTAADLLRAYMRAFPADAAAVARIVRDALLGQELPSAPEIWLANDALMPGTSLFDQYRGLPRPHTFDVNAASELDWLTVPRVAPDLARRLVAGAPYASLEALRTVPDMTPELLAHVSEMSTAMKALLSPASAEEESLSLWSIAMPYLLRLGGVILTAALAGAWLARRARVARRWTAALMGLAAACVTIAFAWIVSSPWWYPVLGPVVLFGVPWAAWRVVRRRKAGALVVPLAAWAAATMPAILVSGVWLR